MLMHSREVATSRASWRPSSAATEAGATGWAAARPGKAVDHEGRGDPSCHRGDLAKKYARTPRSSNAIMTHHGDGRAELRGVGCWCRGGRPFGGQAGRCGGDPESYLKRSRRWKNGQLLQALKKSYAIQAGREIRIIVKPEDLSDAHAAQLSRDIAKKIEAELS